ncbi:hypothetical protein, variant [Exophiala oligosperma]|uniref:AMP-activated protein kinase glycogen-binding domain-containing protein n=1 Tax=Exophiala oligosperma TaxID=215243 RepID=A0A0D2DKF9_9EURO|nr:hypothetical protein, variant [Exophiala oligosperma]KIW43433.1 hypothetical protein, variant [Exophiala oligosperma]
MGSFVFKWPHPDADDVHVTGTFDDWGKTEKLNKVGEVWEKEVQLPKADEKILYKFVVNDNWVIDTEAPHEDDGHGNVNNVLLPENIKTKADALTTSSAAPESTTAALAGAVPLEPRKEATEGAFPETPQQESESYGVNPLPPTAGAGNPVTLPAGEAVPPPGEVTSNSVHSAVTQSQEDYEKAGTTLPMIGGVLPGVGAMAAANTSSGKKENLIPESSLPMGEGATSALDASGPTITSAAPTSTTAALAGQVPLEERKPATVVSEQATTETVPEVVQESIEKAHTSPEATTSAEAVKEKAEVEQELMKKVPEAEEAGEPAPTIAAATSETAPTSATSPSTGAVPGTSSAAAAAVADGAEGGETPSEVTKATHPVEKTEADNTEYAPPVTTSSAPGVSGAAAAAVSDGAEDPTLADEPAVRMMNQNESGEPTSATEAAKTEATPAAEATPKASAKTETPAAAAATPESKKETAAAPTPSSGTGTSTPQKATTTTPAESPASASKEKKKKHRISSLFKKIFD